MLDQAAPIRDIARPERNASPPTAQNIGSVARRLRGLLIGLHAERLGRIPNGRYVPAPCSGKLLTVFAPNRAQNSMPISAPSSKPPAAAPSERSKRCNPNSTPDDVRWKRDVPVIVEIGGAALLALSL
jgi:hypothetical protein